MIKQFEMWGKEKIPQVHEVFRVDSFIGECVGVVYDEDNNSIIALMEIDNSIPIDCLHCEHYFDNDPDQFCDKCSGMRNYIPKTIF